MVLSGFEVVHRHRAESDNKKNEWQAVVPYPDTIDLIEVCVSFNIKTAPKTNLLQIFLAREEKKQQQPTLMSQKVLQVVP